MIKQLRIRFVALSMGLLLVLLAVIVAVFNGLNYRSVAISSDKLVDLLAENGGRFPGGGEVRYEQLDRSFSPELPHESRFFVVETDEDGRVLRINTSRVAAVDSDSAARYAARALESEKERGFLGSYRFRVRDTDDGRLAVFLDCQRSLSDFWRFLRISVAITLLGYLVVFALTILFSGRIVRPFSDNYEKQKQFITNAGHELKTPLAIIQADADVLELDVGESEWLSDIRNQTDRLAKLTNDLIYLSRMEETQPKLQRVEFPISDVVTELAQSFQGPARAQGKTLSVDAEPMLTYLGDEKAIRQLASILLDNALKHTAGNGAIDLRLQRKGKAIVLETENDAQGVEREDLPHLFDRFYRADKSRSAETGGYGIGLSIARAIVTAHRGTIQASIPFPGRFRITATLPM